MSKNFLAYSLLGLIVLLSIIYINKDKYSSSIKSNGSNKLTEDLSGLPVSTKHPAVRAVFFSYNFYGEIKDLIKGSDGTTSLTLMSSGLPTFVLTEKTKINLTSDNKVSGVAQIKDLRKNQAITVVAYYDLNSKVWVTPEIYLAVADRK